MSATLNSKGCLYDSGSLPAACKPDYAPQRNAKPAVGFVLCRDRNGNATAVYGQDAWDFNPYRLSAKKINKIFFGSVFDEEGAEQRALIEEAKYLFYCLIYFGDGGRIGRLNVSTLGHYWFSLRKAMKFCYAQKKKPLVGVLSLEQLFTVRAFLDAFIREGNFDKGAFSGMLGQLLRAGKDRLGYTVLNPSSFDLKRPGSNQHPVIPTRIYLSLINVTGDLLGQLYQGIGAYESFIAAFADEHYAINLHSQKCLGLGGKRNYRPDMPQALMEHGLSEVFTNEFACPFKRDLQTVLLKIQYLAKTIIHLYTGMRDQEVMRMSYNCLSQETVRPTVKDEHGVVRDQPQSVSVLTVYVFSTTTKFTGYKKEAAWIAPGEVVHAIEICQAICRGLAKLYKVELDDECPLFLNPSILGYYRKNTEVIVTGFRSKRLQLNALQALTIQSEDLVELAQSDPCRDFYSDPKFVIGNPWALNSHQFRRALAFYGSSSGFLSLPTVRAQFKQMTIQMARYYSNGFDNLRTIFGYFDNERGQFVLPKDHFAFDFQMAMPMSVANQLIAELLFSEEPLFGGTGSFMQKQAQRVEAGEIHIEEVCADTERRGKSGAINYRPTLLGGCTKVGRCDSFMLGDYTECLSCEGAIIKPEKLNAAIEGASEELSCYAVDSGEYQIVKGDIERLSAFKARLIDTGGL